MAELAFFCMQKVISGTKTAMSEAKLQIRRNVSMARSREDKKKDNLIYYLTESKHCYFKVLEQNLSNILVPFKNKCTVHPTNI